MGLTGRHRVTGRRPGPPVTLALREALDARRDEFQALLTKYAATNPRQFGSVARGTAQAGSDIDIVLAQLLKRPISESALAAAPRGLVNQNDLP